MKGNSADERHHETLRRIVPLLPALAGLAERTACRSWPVRRIVLWLLRPAERAAWAFAAKAGCAAAPLVLVDCLVHGPDDGPDGTARLARQFRALAAAFSALIFQGVARRPDPDRRHRDCPDTAWLTRLLFAPQPRCADTS